MSPYGGLGFVYISTEDPLNQARLFMNLPVEPVLIDDCEEEDAAALPPTKRPKTGPAVAEALVGQPMREVPHQGVPSLKSIFPAIEVLFEALLSMRMIPSIFMFRFANFPFAGPRKWTPPSGKILFKMQRKCLSFGDLVGSIFLTHPKWKIAISFGPGLEVPCSKGHRCCHEQVQGV